MFFSNFGTTDVIDTGTDDHDVHHSIDVGHDKIRDFVLKTLLSKVNTLLSRGNHGPD